ncbi:nucleotidyltransferase family protein [Nocardioides sp.]|uniref:nucleotidyltransferase family protein n=1 Tax=Nocardioides sp. TaxID=35761 RepID=UPI0035180650
MDPRYLEDDDGGPTGVLLHAADAVTLGYAMVDHIARGAGMRCLAIKGPVSAAHGLKPPGASVDVDVLVDPNQSAALRQVLAGHGWLPMDTPIDGRLLPAHSATLGHRSWPITIDLHHRFPGFLADPSVVFEALWAERATIRVAECDVLASGRDGSTLIAALHALREPEHPRSEARMKHLIAARGADDDAHRSLVDLAARTGATETAVSLLRRIGIDAASDPADATAMREWLALTEYGRVRGLGWVRKLRDAPLRERPRILWRAVVTDNEATLRRHGLRPDGSGRRRAHLRRIASIILDVPRLARVLVWDRPLRRLRRPNVHRNDAS